MIFAARLRRRRFESKLRIVYGLNFPIAVGLNLLMILQKLVRVRKNGQRDKKRTSFDLNAVNKNGAPSKTCISERLNDALCFSEKQSVV